MEERPENRLIKSQMLYQLSYRPDNLKTLMKLLILLVNLLFWPRGQCISVYQSLSS